MTDFHTHILPGMDDGSKDVACSLKMLRREREQGIDTVVLTPHFYSSQNGPERFLERREKAWNRLAPELGPDMPRLLLGAEVQYFEGMNNVESLSELRIEGTDLLLLEMPFCRWDDRVIRTVLEMNGCDQTRIVLAHIERYMKFQPSGVWETLRRGGVLMQVNASFFSGWLSRRKAMSMLREDQFQLIGTDCHNMTSRVPDWDPVPEEARKKAGINAKRLLRLG